MIFIILLLSGYLKAEVPDINWYEGLVSNESVLELCYKDKCHRLLHKDDSTEKSIIKEWVDKITLKEYNKETKGKEWKN